MTNWGFDDSQTGDQGNNSDISQPGGLRQFAENTQKENKELKAQLAEIQKTLRDNSVRSVFDELGVPGAAEVYQGDADPTKIRAWVETQRRLFGGTTQGAPSETPAVDVVPDQSLPPMLQQQMEAFTNAGQQGTPLGSMEQAQANINDANDLQGLINAMKFGK